MNNLKIAQAVIKLRRWSTARCLLVQQQQQRFMAQRVTPKSPSSSNSEPPIDNEPIKFFGSQAATWKAKDTRSGGSDEHLSYQPYVISLSLAVFLLYFCVLREENDIDLKLEGNLYEHVEGLEEVQMTMTYKYNKENGLDNREVAKRLTELGIDVKMLDAKISEGN